MLWVGSDQEGGRAGLVQYKFELSSGKLLEVDEQLRGPAAVLNCPPGSNGRDGHGSDDLLWRRSMAGRPSADP